MIIEKRRKKLRASAGLEKKKREKKKKKKKMENASEKGKLPDPESQIVMVLPPHPRES